MSDDGPNRPRGRIESIFEPRPSEPSKARSDRPRRGANCPRNRRETHRRADPKRGDRPARFQGATGGSDPRALTGSQLFAVSRYSGECPPGLWTVATDLELLNQKVPALIVESALAGPGDSLSGLRRTDRRRRLDQHRPRGDRSMISRLKSKPELEKYELLEEIGHGGMATVTARSTAARARGRGQGHPPPPAREPGGRRGASSARRAPLPSSAIRTSSRSTTSPTTTTPSATWWSSSSAAPRCASCL